MLDTALWIAQGFVGLFFLAAGLPKVFGRGIDRWVGFDDLPRRLVIVIGVAEVAAACALIAPMAADAFEWTAPVAAVGLSVISLMASGFHVRASEGLAAIETALWASLTGAIAIGRWTEMSTAPSLSTDVLVVTIAALVPATILNLVLLARRPIPPSADQRPDLTATASER